ncbi:MAG: DUF465 domain-containing protein [Desulfuromonadales bacterium]|nr:DUF465 domain-containing protein [Desulfuromonadales bacterium]
MAEKDLAIIQQLTEENPRFRKLHEEHLLFEKKLQELEERAYLSDEEDLERKKIQKLKLAGRDEMESILKECRP